LTSESVAALWGDGPSSRLTLVVPDGSWRQASKVQSREPALAEAVRVRLALGQRPSEFLLRREPHPESVCTIEAIARALELLEGQNGPAVRAALEHLLRLLVHRTLWSRGAIPRELARPELLPPGALESKHP
jgi:DTW domain-containing protein YfiP